MANAKRCDVCGKYYDPYPDKGIVEPNGVALVWFDSNNVPHIVYDAYDLCYECLGYIREFLERKGE